MASKKVTPLLLAATVALAGATGTFVGAFSPSFAITSVDELTDVNQNHWAFEALRDLVEKYDVIEGYPDKTFKGNKAATRWEMAAALNALIKAVGQDLARLGAQKADKTDLQTLARLQEEFRNELAALNARTSALESRAAAIEAKNVEQDNRLTLLEKTQIHGDMSLGGFQDIGNNGPDFGRRDGFTDGLSMVGRVRLSLDVPVIEDKGEDSLVGEGRVYTRLVGAFGRNASIARSDGLNDGIAASSFSSPSWIAGDASSFNEGFFTNSRSGGGLNGAVGNTRSNLYIESMFYQQHFKAGIPFVTDFNLDVDKESDWAQTSNLYVGVIPWRSLFDKSPYRGYENNQFQNSSLVNTPGIPVNFNMPMVAYQIHQGLGKSANVELTTGLGSISAGNVYDGMNLTYEGRLNYITSFLGENYAKPGSFYAGGYHIWSNGSNGVQSALTTTNVAGVGGTPIGANSGAPLGGRYTVDGSTNGVYLGWNQEWFRGIGTTFNYVLNNLTSQNVAYSVLNANYGANPAFTQFGLVSNVKQAVSGVLSVPVSALLPGKREKDTLGVGYALLDLQQIGVQSVGSDQYKQRSEHVLETFYNWQINDAVSVTPSFQLIGNRFGQAANDLSYVIGLRTTFKF
jgi:hypothetical protein